MVNDNANSLGSGLHIPPTMDGPKGTWETAPSDQKTSVACETMVARGRHPWGSVELGMWALRLVVMLGQEEWVRGGGGGFHNNAMAAVRQHR